MIKERDKITILTSWTFDCVHPWHSYYLNTAKQYWDYLITIIWTDKNVEKIKWKPPINSQEKRKEDIESLNISNKVIIWSEKNPYKHIEKYKPQIICLWYDQRWKFVSNLQKYIDENNLKTKIIRIKPYKQDKYKSSKIKEKRA